MKRREFLTSVGVAITASFAPALPAFTAPVVTMLPRPRSYSIPPHCRIGAAQDWILDAVFENIKNEPPLDGTFHVSLHTANGDVPD